MGKKNQIIYKEFLKSKNIYNLNKGYWTRMLKNKLELKFDAESKSYNLNKELHYDGNPIFVYIDKNLNRSIRILQDEFEIEKDKSVGDIFMICTDGIYSADQLKAGKNEKGVWVRYEPTMLKFFEYLKHFFKNNQLYNKESVEQTINLYLEELKSTFDDDATLGILITKEALNYQNQINWLNKDENISGNTI